MSAARECQWTASADANWLSVTGAASGQGDGTVRFNAAANPDPVTRTGGVVVNGERSPITQAAAECRFDVSPAEADFPADGGTGTVQVTASSGMCAWNAASRESWIVIRSGSSGSGSRQVTFDVAQTSGASRRGTLTVAGRTVTIDQAAAPASPAPPSPTPTPTPTPPPTPTPTPTPPPTPSPPPTPPPPVPPPACTYAVDPTTVNVGEKGGTKDVKVKTTKECAWTATSNVPWIQITSGASGTGSDDVKFRVSETGQERNGTLTVAGQTVTVRQR